MSPGAPPHRVPQHALLRERVAGEEGGIRQGSERRNGGTQTRGASHCERPFRFRGDLLDQTVFCDPSSGWGQRNARVISAVECAAAMNEFQRRMRGFGSNDDRSHTPSHSIKDGRLELALCLLEHKPPVAELLVLIGGKLRKKGRVCRHLKIKEKICSRTSEVTLDSNDPMVLSNERSNDSSVILCICMQRGIERRRSMAIER